MAEFKEQTQEYLELEGRQLFWGRKFSRSEIFFRTIGGLMKILARIIAIVLGVFGLLSLFNHLWLVYQSGSSFLELDVWQGKYLDYFIWSLLTDTYIFYSFGLDRGKVARVVRKSYKKETTVKPAGRIRRIDMADSFTAETLKTIDRAYLKAAGQNKVLDHFYLFAEILKTKKAAVIFGRLGVSAKSIGEVAKNLLSRSPEAANQETNERLNKVLARAYFYAYQDGRQNVGLADLLQAAVESEPVLQELLLDYKITLEQIINVVKWININKVLLDKYKHFRAQSTYKPKGTMDRAMTALATPMLDSFSEDLTSLARAGYLSLCVARDQELEEIFNIIEGGGSSVLLIGQHGVGSSNIIEGLANLMVAEEVPKRLRDKRLVSLSVPKLVAGASHPGELEQRLLIIMKEVTRAGNVILHIDDVHNLVGVTSVGSENVELSEMFADFITSRSLITIATTTPHDFAHYLENHPLGQAMQTVKIDEPDDNRAIQMVESKVGYIESKNEVVFAYDALEKAVKLSRRFIPDHYLPTKAINFLEEVGVKVRQEKGKNKLVSGEDVVALISSKTSIPLTEITQDETEKLLNLENRIHQRMVNQEEAVNLVSSALRRARAELRDVKRPIVNLLFLGPTGVGKTELAKTVASIYFGSEDNMIRVDMSEYQLKESVNRLIGGGASEQGVLTEAVRKKPFSLILFDEIEKAHPDILNLFLQMMDDGRLTDASGRTVDFSNAIIIGTSNAGTQFLQDALLAGKSLEEIKNELMLNELKQYFKPEFLNRFDGIVVFKPLSREHIEKIAGLMLNKVKKRLENKGIFLEATPEAVKELAQAGFDPMFGARPLRRVIQDRVDNSLANYLLRGKLSRRDKVILEAGGQLRVEKAKRF